MTALDKIVLLISADAAFTERVLAELSPRRPRGENPASPRGHYQVWMAASLAQGRERLADSAPRHAGLRDHMLSPAAIVLDDSAVEAFAAAPSGSTRAGPIAATRLARKPQLAAAAFELAEFAPVVVVAAPERLGELASAAELIAAGTVDCVARAGDYLPLLLTLVDRFAASMPRAALPADAAEREAFGEVLRHEVNNPLTGILGNAELLLARREKLSDMAIQRLETIAELAVRLRETIRRLSYSFENGWPIEADASPAAPDSSPSSTSPSVLR